MKWFPLLFFAIANSSFVELQTRRHDVQTQALPEPRFFWVTTFECPTKNATETMQVLLGLDYKDLVKVCANKEENNHFEIQVAIKSTDEIQFNQDDTLRNAVHFTLTKKSDDPLAYTHVSVGNIEEDGPITFVKLTLTFEKIVHFCKIETLQFTTDYRGPITTKTCNVVDRTAFAIL